MDDFSEQKVETQQVRSKSNWPAIVGGVVAAVVLLGVIGVVAWQLGWLSALNPFSGWATPVEIELNPSGTSDETRTRQYDWSYDGRPWKLTLQIPEEVYDYYHRMERAPIEDYSVYVTHPGDDDKLIDPLAAELKRRAVERGYDPEETVNFAASFVQNLTYTLERDEYPKYPVETLVDKGGDCEDMAILTAALLQAMDYDAVLIRFSPPIEGEAGHMAVGVAVAGVSGDYYRYDGKNYYYLETTASWPVGETPSDIVTKYKGESDAIYKLIPAPALRFTKFAWRVNDRWFGSDTMDLEVSVTNWGTADADALYVRAFFEGYEGSAKSSATYDLAYGYQISGVATKGILVPSGGGILRVELFEDGVKVDDWSQYIS